MYFTKEQINDLKQEAWGKSNATVDKFISVGDQVIKDWVDFGRRNLTAAEEKEQCKNLGRACRVLLDTLNKTNVSIFDSISKNIDNLISEFDYDYVDLNIENYEAAALSVCLGVSDSGSGSSDLNAVLWFKLKEILKIIEKNTSKIQVSIKPKKAPENRDNMDLIYLLAVYYYAIFKKYPSGSSNGNFYRYVRKVGEIINVHITRPETNKSIKKMKVNFSVQQ